MTEKTVFAGKLLLCCEQGYEGSPWVLCVDEEEAKERWQFIRPGDALRVEDASGNIVYDAIVLIGKERGSLFNLYWYPQGISRPEWARMFLEGYSAKLARAIPNSVAERFRDLTWKNLTHFESYEKTSMGNIKIIASFYFQDPDREPTRLELWFDETSLCDVRPL